MKRLAALLFAPALLGFAAAAAAQSKPAVEPKPGTTVPGAGVFGTASKEPISIEADQLEVFDRDQRAVYRGNVVVVQGDTTMKSGEMVVHYARGQQAGDDAAARPAAGAPAGPGGTTVRRVEAFGGVSIISKDQVATGREGIFDRENNRVILIGDVSLAQGGNVTKGERLNYDLTTGQATVEARASAGRVRSLLVPGSEDGAKPIDRPAAPAVPAKIAPAVPAAPVAPTAPKPPVRP
jgi:lipopolysaccharide export system protein LptA